MSIAEMNRIICADALTGLVGMPSDSVDCCITSPPYFGLRDYGVVGQIGLERDMSGYMARLLAVFREVYRVLKPEGTLWLNIGDGYASKPDPSGQHKAKDLLGVPWTLAFALRADGWYLRQDIIWAKPDPMPESIKNRCTKSHEYIFLLTKQERYHFDSDAVKEKANPANAARYRSPFFSGAKDSTGRGRPGGTKNTAGSRPYTGYRNKRDVWLVSTKTFRGAHCATFPEALIEPCVLAGCPPGGVVLDPFAGSGTVGVVAERHGRRHIGFDLNPAFCDTANGRIQAHREATGS